MEDNKKDSEKSVPETKDEVFEGISGAPGFAKNQADAVDDVSGDKGSHEKAFVSSEPCEPLAGYSDTFSPWNFIKDFWQGLMARQVISKLIALVFALLVFGFTYMHMLPHRNVLTYMGVMLLMVLVYAEILVIRDHLWVIEGSMRESKRWRDIFFSHTTLRRQRMRKFLIMFFTMMVFSYIFVKSQGRADPLLSFMGIILLITILYYEVLSIRDEVWIMSQALLSGKLPAQKEDVPLKKEVPSDFIDVAIADSQSEEKDTDKQEVDSEK